MQERNKSQFHQHLYECLGKIVANRRKRLGMSLEELAEKDDVDRAFISKVESGKRKPSFGLVANLAHGLHMRYGRLAHNCEQCALDEMEKTA